jgi:hypothetical protein
MIPTSPVIEGREEDEVRLGAEQAEFQTLPALTFRDDEGVKSLSRWILEEGEREELLRTGSIYVSQITGGRAPRPIMPSVFPPDIPDRAPDEGRDVEGEGVGRIHVEPVIFEFRMVALDRESGNPVSGVEGGARLFVDLTTLAGQFPTSGHPTGDATEIISRQLETLARVLASAYGADVYFRLYGSDAAGWQVVEGKLEGGAHVRRTIHADNAGRLPEEIDAAILDLNGADVAESIRMMKALRDTFAPPFYLIGFSPVEAPSNVAAVGDVITEVACQNVPAVVAHFRTMLRANGDFCLLIRSDQYTPPDSRVARAGFFLLDLRLYDRSRSN